MFNSTTKSHLDQVSLKLPQGLLLSGPRGVGLLEAAEFIANAHNTVPLIVRPEKDDTPDENGSISIEIIRRLYQQTRTALPVKRIVIIYIAETMGIPAQNAFLKLLEEPGPSTHFILVSSNERKLLPTIRSRVQQIEVRPISTAESIQLLTDLGVKDSTKQQQLLFIAKGLPSELKKLVSDADYFETRSSAMRSAKLLLTGDLYSRLKVVSEYGSGRESALQLVSDCLTIMERSTGDKNSQNITKIDILLDTYERLIANGNSKLQLARICYN